MLKKAIQQGRRRVETGGVPSGVRWGFRWAENEVGGLFQHPDSPVAVRRGTRLSSRPCDIPGYWLPCSRDSASSGPLPPSSYRPRRKPAE